MAWMTAQQIQAMHRLTLETLQAGGRFTTTLERGHRRYHLLTADGVRVDGVGEAAFANARARLNLVSRIDDASGRFVYEVRR